MADILPFPGTIDLADSGLEDEGIGPHILVEDLLEGLKEKEFSDLIIIGQMSEGLYFASTSGDPASILWDMEKAKHILLEAYFNGQEDLD